MLLVPFIRAGEILFQAPRLSLSLPQIMSMIHASVWQAIKTLWVATVHAIAVWAILAPLAICLIYRVLAPVLGKIAEARDLVKPKTTVPGIVEVP